MMKTKPERYLVVNPRQGKGMMIGGVVLSIIGLFTLTGGGWILMLLGAVLFAAGKFKSWFNN